MYKLQALICCIIYCCIIYATIVETSINQHTAKISNHNLLLFVSIIHHDKKSLYKRKICSYTWESVSKDSNSLQIAIVYRGFTVWIPELWFLWKNPRIKQIRIVECKYTNWYPINKLKTTWNSTFKQLLEFDDVKKTIFKWLLELTTVFWNVLIFYCKNDVRKLESDKRMVINGH